MQSTTLTTLSPSFTSHSSNNLADVAARVIEELRHENHDDIFNFNDHDDHNTNDNNCNNIDDTDDFEFAVVNLSSISSNDQIISHGHILPHYPLFDTSLLSDVDPNLIPIVTNRTMETDRTPSLVVRLPLMQLFNEERDFAVETDDLAGITPETYCLWKPKPESLEKCNSSRRWKFRDILYRSKSDRDKTTPFLFFKPLISTNKKVHNEKVKNVEKTDGVPAVKRRRSYGQALVGALTNVSQSNRNLRPF